MSEVYTLKNAPGMEVRFIAYGGIIMSVRVADRNGAFDDVTPGYDTPEEYGRDGHYFGALIGRYANRIAGGRITTDDGEYQLDQNEGTNQLHGGRIGFHNSLWSVAPFKSDDGAGAVLRCRSEAGEGGYPGNLVTRVTYTLRDDNSFTIDYSAITDVPTPVNLTQHTYFNLAGQANGDILDHELALGANAYTPVHRDLIPTGEIRPVLGSPFDFTAPRRIGDAMAGADEQLAIAGGFDHNFVLNRSGAGPSRAATVYEPTTGRVLDVFTTEPGIQFYSGNGLADGPPGKCRYRYPRYGAFALETQHFPDSPNHPAFPSTLVRPGDEYQSKTIWRFSTRPARG